MKIPKRNHLIQMQTPEGKLVQVKTNEFRYRVYETIKNLNTKLNRVVLVAEVTQAYVKAYEIEVKEFSKLRDAVCKVLNSFVEYKLIFTKKQNKYRVYGSLEILDPDQDYTYEVIINPLWQKILKLVYKAVEYYGKRPVRCHDVNNYAKDVGITEFSSTQITYNIWALSRTSHLNIVGQVQNDGFGSTLFLPSDINLSEVNPVGILTFSDFLVDVFTKMWEERVKKARENNCLIRPLLTSEIRKRLKQTDQEQKFSRTNSEISSLLNHLANKSSPQIRYIALVNKVKMWAMASAQDEELDLENVFSSDALKVVTAVNRAYLKSGKHPVTLTEIKNELNQDETLKLHSKLSLGLQLSILVNRKNLNKNEKLKNINFTEYVLRLGSIGNKTYYTPAKYKIEKDVAYFQFYKLKIKWEKFKKEQSWQKIENCQLNSVRIGRIKLFVQEIQEFLKELSRVNSKYFQTNYNKLMEEIKFVEEQANTLLASQISRNVPKQVNQQISGLIAKETNEFLAPFYPVATRIQESKTDNPNRITSRIGHKFRRIPNPDFRTRKSHLPKYTNRKMYELTDLYIQTALRWGGDECRYQALIAQQELGNLRDERFVVKELTSPNFEARQIAIACLAFLQTGGELFANLAVKDTVPEIRQAALWASAFINGNDYKTLAEHISKQDYDTTVRNFAERIAASTSEIDIWRM